MRSSKEFQQGVNWSDLQFEELIWFAVRRTQYIKIEQLRIDRQSQEPEKRT